MAEDWREKHKNLGAKEVKIVEKVVRAIKKVLPNSEKGKQALRNLGVAFEKTRTKIDLNSKDLRFRQVYSALVESLQEVYGASKENGTDYVSIQQAQYQRTGNPLYVWNAFEMELEKSQLPDWVKDYFDRTCYNLFQLSEKVVQDEAPKGREFYQEVMKVFGLETRTEFKELGKWRVDMDTMWTLDEYKEKMRKGEIDRVEGQGGQDCSAEIVGGMVKKGKRTVETRAARARKAEKFVSDALQAQNTGDRSEDE